MGNTQSSETGRDVPPLSNTESGDIGPFTGSTDQTTVGGHNNLFFRTDDGRILAVQISPALEAELLRGLAHPAYPAELRAPTFVLASSTTVDNDIAGVAQTQPSTANASAQPNFPASDANRAAEVSSNRSTPDPHESSALSGTLRPDSGARIVNVDTWVDEIFSAEAYDRNWMINHDVNSDILEGHPSKHKLNVLVKHGTVFVDDILCVTYHSSGRPTVIEGVILPESTSSNLSVRILPARADVDVIIHRVQGPRDLIRGMNKEYAARYDEPVSEGWKAVRLVSSTGEEYGTLFEVRQAYQVWTDEKAKWEARNRRVGSGRWTE